MQIDATKVLDPNNPDNFLIAPLSELERGLCSVVEDYEAKIDALEKRILALEAKTCDALTDSAGYCPNCNRYH